MLHHVSLEVLPADADAFADLLPAIGWEPLEAPEALGGNVDWYERQGTQIHLIRTEGATVPVLGHPALVVEDFAAAIEELRRRGFEVQDARELWGEPRAFVIAPGGHRIELMAAPPP
jgi:hypothetical protein